MIRTLLYIIFMFCFFDRSFGQDSKAVVSFSHHGGPMERSISLILSSDGPGIIRYTKDGSKPNYRSPKYKSPISIKKTSVIRARVFNGRSVGEVSTRTFILEYRPFTTAIVCITTNKKNLWGYDRGIYVKGCCADSAKPYRGANYWKDWEREANIEMYEPNGKLAFNQLAGIKIFGGYSRPLPQKSLAIIARKKYGKNSFEHKIFPDENIKEFKSFVLRNSGGDWRHTLFRDMMLTDLAKEIGLDVQNGRPSIVFINGKYWGIHNIREKINEHYIASHHPGVNKDSIDLIKKRYNLQKGSRGNYKSFIRYIESRDLRKQRYFDRVSRWIDIENYTKHHIFQVFIGNVDAAGNIRFWRDWNNKGKWKWILFDTDLSFYISNKCGPDKNHLDLWTTLSKEKWPNPEWSTLIIRKLMENEWYRSYYIHTFSEMLNSTFKAEHILEKIDQFKDLYAEEIKYHYLKWPNKNRRHRKNWPEPHMKEWEGRIELLRDFARRRSDYVWKHLQNKFNLEPPVELDISFKNKGEGSIWINKVSVVENWKGRYFKGDSLKISAKPGFDYLFGGWEGNVEKSPEMRLKIGESASFIPLFVSKIPSVLKDKIVITEFCISSNKKVPVKDWIEIVNLSNDSIKLKGWQIRDSKDENLAFIKNDIKIGGGEYLIFTNAPKLFNKHYPDVRVIRLKGKLKLNEESDRIRLYDKDSLLVDSLSFNISSWPVLNWKNERILTLDSPLVDNANQNNWVPAESKGTPGEKNPSNAKLRRNRIRIIEWVDSRLGSD